MNIWREIVIQSTKKNVIPMENKENNSANETAPDNKELKFSFLRSFVLLIKYLKDVIIIRECVDVEG